MRKFIYGLVAISALSLPLISSCGNSSSSKNDTHTVTFKFEEEVLQTLSVKNGKRIEEKVNDPVFPDETYRFLGWYTEKTYTDNLKWNFDVDIVTSSLSLYAGYQIVTGVPSNIKMSNEAYSSTLTWSQASLSTSDEVNVKLYSLTGSTYETTGVSLNGTASFDQTNQVVSYVPTTIPQGGIYKVGVQVGSEQEIFQENLLFKGDGTINNPYLASNAIDIAAINATEGVVGTNKYYRLESDIEITTNFGKQVNTTFNGSLNGNGKSINITQGGVGLFYKLGQDAIVDNLLIKGSVSTGDNPYLASLANINQGTIKNSKSIATVTSTTAPVAVLDTASEGGAGGLVGYNDVNGKVLNCTFEGTDEGGSADGVVKSTIGGGCIVGTNYGLIDGAVNKGCFGAYNSTETGKSLSNYSYSGGIVGFNYGRVVNSSTRSVGKLLAQRYATTPEAGAKNNIAIGGIAGYNLANGTIESCYFEGIRVHGDQAVGGIAGINAGAISNSYASAKYFSSTGIRSYVGGRVEVGGIAGRLESTGTVSNCYSTVNVFAYAEKAFALASAASNSVYISNNLDAANAKYGTPFSDELTAPTGSNNVLVNTSYITPGSEGSDQNYCLPATYLSTLGEGYYFDEEDNTIRLVNEKNIDTTVKIRVNFLVNNVEQSHIVVEEGGEGLSVPSVNVENYVHEGWSTTVDGEVVFSKTAIISYNDVASLATDGVVNLYAKLSQNTDPIVENKLVVAYIENKVSEDIINNLQSAFNAYLVSKNVTIDEIIYRGYAQTKVADYCASIVSDGDVDVILGVGNNIDSNIAETYFVSKTNISINSDDSRYVAVLNMGGNTDNLTHFMNYIVTTEAEAVLNPAVRTNTIVVAFWASYVDEDMLETLKTAFIAYLQEQGVTVSDIQFKYINASKVINLVDAIQADPTIDVIVGGGGNIGSTAGTNGEKLSVTNNDVTIKGATRKVSVLNGTENLVNAQDFVKFLETDAAKAILNPTV